MACETSQTLLFSGAPCKDASMSDGWLATHRRPRQVLNVLTEEHIRPYAHIAQVTDLTSPVKSLSACSQLLTRNTAYNLTCRACLWHH